ncbi:hypothetical protein TRFO_14592 [Tritrichomonas foetus]|uniref:Uncharacterized protein n=1 Tax=Tritrichomonas foetus TaxID=1144522 RepID=A0A1J4KUZ4_9EUKA|nr:hypothetical protein TRFO_14592 [Tritrichomonas foetus]|eukprot:OHT14946.1 hypothetical protein TRFO_14592 [Tritrichomonas foetus]
MRFLPLFFFAASVIIGYTATYIQKGSSSLNEVYVDVHGDSWRVPTDGFITQITNKAINAIPRFNYKFQTITPLFDLDNTDYVQSTLLYIVLCGGFGLLFFVIVMLFFIFRYICGCCGGKALPRRGYSQTMINSVRISLIVFSFIFEGILMYGYFANSDLHGSLTKVVGHFSDIGDEIEKDMVLIIEKITEAPDTYNHLLNNNKKQMIEDLNFSTRYAVEQTKIMHRFVRKFENLRMALILLNLVLSTVGCAVGIAAGSVMRGCVMIIMVIMNTISTVFFFFSTGAHFAGAKIVYEYCDEISYYISDVHFNERIPMRLQYFIPCVNSPLFSYLNDYFAQTAVTDINALMELYKTADVYADNSTMLYCSPPMWFNVTDAFYNDLFNRIADTSKKFEVLHKYETAKSTSTDLSTLDRERLCTFSKQKMKDESFLMCKYTKDNLDMITMSQAIGCLLVIIIICIGLPAIKKFEWAGNANLGGILNGKKQTKFMGKNPKAKRTAGKR